METIPQLTDYLKKTTKIKERKWKQSRDSGWEEILEQENIWMASKIRKCRLCGEEEQTKK